jgi:hypothetical protein
LLVTEPVGLFQLTVYFLLNGQCNIEGEGIDGLYEQLTDRLVNRSSADALTGRSGVLHPFTLAQVFGPQEFMSAVIAHRHALAATAA